MTMTVSPYEKVTCELMSLVKERRKRQLPPELPVSGRVELAADGASLI